VSKKPGAEHCVLMAGRITAMRVAFALGCTVFWQGGLALETHAATYIGIRPTAFMHRNRLTHVLRILGGLNIGPRQSIADFGCSDGYIISLLQQRVFQDADHEYFGFDNSRDLLDLARARNLPHSRFELLDLNVVTHNWSERFGVVLCLETLEHVGDQRAALENLYLSCSVGGLIVISIPNEVGVVGLAKYLGRKLCRRRPYGSFFDNQSGLEYAVRLVLYRDIEEFRHSRSDGWGPHLGFDWRLFRQRLSSHFLSTGKLGLKHEERSFMGFNILYVLVREG